MNRRLHNQVVFREIHAYSWGIMEVYTTEGYTNIVYTNMTWTERAGHSQGCEFYSAHENQGEYSWK